MPPELKIIIVVKSGFAMIGSSAENKEGRNGTRCGHFQSFGPMHSYGGAPYGTEF